MKRKIKIIISASAATVLAFTALAQDPPDLKTDRPDFTRERAPQRQRSDQLNEATKSSELIGMTVKNQQDEKLGKVEDLAVDVESGRIVQVILSTGGFLGVGDTLTAVPPRTLHHEVALKILRLDADKAKLKSAPQFDATKWDESATSNRVTEVYAYYGEAPYFAANRDGVGPAIIKAPYPANLARNHDGTINTDGARTVDKVRNAEIARSVEENFNTVSTRNPDGSWNRKYYPSADGASQSGEQLRYVEKASKLVGTPVQNQQAEKLGKVENVLVDLAAGRIVAVIVSSGGFLGLGDELSAVPPTALRFTADHNTLQLDASREMLSNAPHFQANQWPNIGQPSYAEGIYRAYQVEPYFPTGVSPKPDDTVLNIRDRVDRPLTPLDQGSSKADVATTAQIRKEIIAGKDMSVNARNVKIITRDGQVTLRGPVNTLEEKRLIGEIADRSEHSGSVANQLEVKSTNKTIE